MSDELFKDSSTAIKENSIYLFSGIEGDAALQIATYLDSTKPEIEKTMYINSTGGDIYDMLAIMNAMKGHNIHGIVTGCAASAAALILLCCPKRSAHRYSFLMMHDSLVSTDQVKKTDLENYTQIQNIIFKDMMRDLLQKTKITEKTYNEKTKNDWFITPKQALTLGIIHKIIK